MIKECGEFSLIWGDQGREGEAKMQSHHQAFQGCEIEKKLVLVLRRAIEV